MEDFNWDLSNSTSNPTNKNSSSSAPNTDISKGVGFVNLIDDVQESEPQTIEEISSGTHSDEYEESLQESRRRKRDSHKTPRRANRLRSADFMIDGSRSSSQGRLGPPSSDPVPRWRTSSPPSQSRDLGGGVEALMQSDH